MSNTIRLAASLGAALMSIAAASSAHATAVAPESTFYFNANCADCASAANAAGFGVLGTLVLAGYTPGDAITAANFVSFTYSGSNLVAAYSVTLGGDDGDAATNDFMFLSEFDTVSGAIPAALPAGADFDLRFDDGLRFNAAADGNWYTCAPAPGWNVGNGAYYGGGDCFNHQNNDNGTGQFGNAANVVLGPTGNQVPVPATAALAAFGLLAAGGIRRRRR